MRRRLSELHPILYRTRIGQKRLLRRLKDISSLTAFAIEKTESDLPFTCKKHQSLLRRRLGSFRSAASGKQDRESQDRPSGHRPADDWRVKLCFGVLSARRTPIRATAKECSFRAAKSSAGSAEDFASLQIFFIGWRFIRRLRSRNDITTVSTRSRTRTAFYRSEAAAGVFYNYVDLRFFNPTDVTFEIKLWITDSHLKGAECRISSCLAAIMSLKKITGLFVRMKEIFAKTRSGVH